MTDFHSHILPGIDDGSKSINESLWMLEESKKQDVDIVVATPHFYPWLHNPEIFLENREKALIKLNEAIDDKNKYPEVIVGAEVYYFEGISQIEALPYLAIGDTDYMLIEMPSVCWNKRMLDELSTIKSVRGITPIIAHINRYIKFQKGISILDALIEREFLIQCNTEYFINPLTSSKAVKMLRKGQIHLLGTDCHNKKNRIPDMKKAIKIITTKTDDNIISNIDSLSKKILKKNTCCERM